MLRESGLTLEVNEFRCYEAKTEESVKVSSSQELNLGQTLGSIPTDAGLVTFLYFCFITIT